VGRQALLGAGGIEGERVGIAIGNATHAARVADEPAGAPIGGVAWACDCCASSVSFKKKRGKRKCQPCSTPRFESVVVGWQRPMVEHKAVTGSSEEQSDSRAQKDVVKQSLSVKVQPVTPSDRRQMDSEASQDVPRGQGHLKERERVGSVESQTISFKLSQRTRTNRRRHV